MTQEAKIELNAIVDAIKNTVKAKEIYLFGSFARGEEREYSDFDVYVVLQDEETRRPIECEQDIHYACYDIVNKGLDVLTEHFSKFQFNNQGVVKIVKEEGVKLYG